MKKTILLKGPILTRSGYGEQTRFALRALRSQEQYFDIFIHPIQWGHTSWLNEENDERKWIDQAIEKTIPYIQQGGHFDYSLQVTIPNEWEKLATTNIGYTAGIETTKVAPVWLQKANENVNKIIVVSNHAKQVYENTTATAVNDKTGQQMDYPLTVPVTTVNYPVKQYDNIPELELELSTDFNFLVIAQFGPRKNLQNTIEWFMQEFHDENVGMVLKSNFAKNCTMDRKKLVSDLKLITDKYPDKKCKLYVLHGDMTDDEIHSLYKHKKLNAFLALPHGEGFGLPIFEAMYSGMPVITVPWSGQCDYLVDEDGKYHCYQVAYDLQPVQPEVVWENVLIAESMWAYAREQSAKRQMRQCYDDITNNVKDSIASNASKYAEVLKERFSEKKMYEQFVDCILPTRDMKEIESEIDDLLADLL